VRVQVDPHTLESAKERGASEEEIRDVIGSGLPLPAKYSRMGKTKTYSFNRKRYGKYYEEKRIEVFYTIEEDVIITVMVYVFYGKWR